MKKNPWETYREWAIPQKKTAKKLSLWAKKYIKKGDIFQVVLSQRFETNLSKNPLDIYKKLRTTNPSPFMNFFNIVTICSNLF